MRQIRNIAILLVVMCLSLSKTANAELSFYVDDNTREKSFLLRDERLLNDITSIRLSLLAGERLRAIEHLHYVLTELKDNREVRRYLEVPMVLARFGEGRNDPYLYFPPSYNDKVYNNQYLEKSPEAELLGKAKLDDVVAELQIKYSTFTEQISEAYNYAQQKNLEKADFALQDIYEDMIEKVRLKHDPIRDLEDRLKLVASLFNEKKTSEALKVLAITEKAMHGHLQLNPDAPYASNLLKVQPGFDKIKAYNWDGDARQVSVARINSARTLSDMRSKIGHLEIDLPH